MSDTIKSDEIKCDAIKCATIDQCCNIKLYFDSGRCVNVPLGACIATGPTGPEGCVLYSVSLHIVAHFSFLNKNEK